MEDMPTFKSVGVCMKMDVKEVKAVRVIPSLDEIVYSYVDNKLTFEIPELTCYQAVEIDY